MKIAIHHSDSGFHPRWIRYCEENAISYKVVNCYADNIIDQLSDCNALMWHHSQSNPKDIVIAKQILFALEHANFQVFPNFNTSWHFDDKVGQKYLFEALKLPMVPSYVFVNKNEALNWAENTTFPKVFKLRGGAGSANVKLVKRKKDALKLINTAFGKGFKQYDAWYNLKDRIYKFREGKGSLYNIFKGIARFGYEPEFSKTIGRERGYIYFQDFIPNQDSDIRIIIVGYKAFALKRMVRKGDFRASGSGDFYFEKNNFDIDCIKLAFKANEEIKSQCIAFDFIFNQNNNPLIVEISYGFTPEAYDNCPGYWDRELNWYQGSFNPQGWMVENLLRC